MSKILKIMPKIFMGLLIFGQKIEAYRSKSKIYSEINKNFPVLPRSRLSTPHMISSPTGEISIDLKRRVLIKKENIGHFIFLPKIFNGFYLKNFPEKKMSQQIFSITEIIKKFTKNLRKEHYINYFMLQSLENFTIQDAFSMENPRGFKFLSVEKIITDVYGLEKYMVIHEEKPYYKLQSCDTLEFANKIDKIYENISTKEKIFSNKELKNIIEDLFRSNLNKNQKYLMLYGINKNLDILSLMNSPTRNVLEFKNFYKKNFTHCTRNKTINLHIVSILRKVLVLEICLPLLLNKEEIEKNILEKQKNYPQTNNTIIQKDILKKEIANLESFFFYIKEKLLNNLKKAKIHYENTTGKIFGINLDISFDVVAKNVLKNILYWKTLENSEQIVSNKINLLTTTMGLLLIKKEILNYNPNIPFVNNSYMGKISSTIVNIMTINIYEFLKWKTRFSQGYLKDVQDFWAQEKTENNNPEEPTE